MYISIDVDGHRHLMGRRTQITLTDRQHAFLRNEAERTGLPMTELIRRAVDATYRPYWRLRVRGFELSLGSVATSGRRPGRPPAQAARAYAWLKKPPRSSRRARSSALTSTFWGVRRKTLSATRCMPPSSAYVSPLAKSIRRFESS